METVEKIMTKDIYKINVSSSLSEANAIFDSASIRHLPVVLNDRLVGMLSKTDIMRLSFGDTYGGDETDADDAMYFLLTIKDVMIRNPRVISSDDLINDVADIFVKEEYHALPVTNGEKLVGIITTTDIIKYLLEKNAQSKIPRKHVEKRPWGNFEKFCQNIPCTVKIINVSVDEELSLQYHHNRNEFWRVIQGEGIFVIGEKEIIVKQGDEFVIPAKTIHQMKTINNTLQVLEISYGDFDENDIVRLADKYHRENKLNHIPQI